mmetsp:Transcript_24370/g.68336  ORF Transcript_24370/g.68336 Transcript_24370/m.68336 type:complete len:210 (+) Transcript_24370:589-1218(+)
MEEDVAEKVHGNQIRLFVQPGEDVGVRDKFVVENGSATQITNIKVRKDKGSFVIVGEVHERVGHEPDLGGANENDRDAPQVDTGDVAETVENVVVDIVVLHITLPDVDTEEARHGAGLVLQDVVGAEDPVARELHNAGGGVVVVGGVRGQVNVPHCVLRNDAFAVGTARAEHTIPVHVGDGVALHLVDTVTGDGGTRGREFILPGELRL